MTIPPDILRENARFLEGLTLDVHTPLHVNRDGRIQPRGRISRIFDKVVPRRLFSDSVIKSSVDVLIAERSTLDDAAFRVFLTATLAKLEAHGALTPALKNQILSTYQDRILQGYRRRLDVIYRTAVSSPVASAGAGSATPAPDLDDESRILVQRADLAMELASDPLLPEETRSRYGCIPTSPECGRSESFFIQDLDGCIGIFKPRSGEIGMPGNTRKKIILRDEGHPEFILGVEIGTMYKREIAASKFYSGHLGTVPVTCSYSLPGASGVADIGSLQSFVKDSYTYDDYAHTTGSSFLDDASYSTAQGLLIRDCLMGSCDRHLGNLLFKDGILFGIDNGMSFPEGLTRGDGPISSTATTMALRASSMLTLEDDVLRDISLLDIDAEIGALRREGLISLKQAFEMKMRHALLIKLVDVDPKLKVVEIASCFMPQPEKKPAITLIVENTWRSFVRRGEDCSKGITEDNFEKFFYGYVNEIDEFFTEKKIDEMRKEFS